MYDFKVKNISGCAKYNIIPGFYYSIIDGCFYVDLPPLGKPLVNNIQNIDDLNNWAYDLFDGFFVKDERAVNKEVEK